MRSSKPVVTIVEDWERVCEGSVYILTLCVQQTTTDLTTDLKTGEAKNPRGQIKRAHEPTQPGEDGGRRRARGVGGQVRRGGGFPPLLQERRAAGAHPLRRRCTRRGMPQALMLDHVSPATRLLEKRRQMFEVQEALETQKQEFNRKARAAEGGRRGLVPNVEHCHI